MCSFLRDESVWDRLVQLDSGYAPPSWPDSSSPSEVLAKGYVGEGMREGGRRTFHSSGEDLCEVESTLAKEGQSNPSSLRIRLTDPKIRQFRLALLFYLEFCWAKLPWEPGWRFLYTPENIYSIVLNNCLCDLSKKKMKYCVFLLWKLLKSWLNDKSKEGRMLWNYQMIISKKEKLLRMTYLFYNCCTNILYDMCRHM